MEKFKEIIKKEMPDLGIVDQGIEAFEFLKEEVVHNIPEEDHHLVTENVLGVSATSEIGTETVSVVFNMNSMGEVQDYPCFIVIIDSEDGNVIEYKKVMGETK